MTHTPGPWMVLHEVNVVSSSGRGIAACGGYQNSSDPGGTHDENMANARLIAAAPRLLEACKLVVEFGDIWQAEGNLSEAEADMIEICRAAIAEAEAK